MDLSSKPQRSADYRLEQIEDELLLYHPGQTTILYCNQTASLVWHLCDGQYSVEEVTALLSQTYPDSAALADDVVAALRQFAEHGAIAFG